MGIVVVLPTYQEADNIRPMLTALTGSAAQVDVLVVDDSSPDGTGAIVRQFQLECPGRVHLLSRGRKQGLGAAYRAGFSEALRLGYDVVVQMDADGSHPVVALTDMVRQLEAGADVVIGSRYCPGGAVSADWPAHRRALSRAGNFYARAMLRVAIHDITGGFKMWRASALRQIDLPRADASGYGFQIQMTMLALARGARVAEVPILFTARTLGASKMNHSIVAEAFTSVLRLRAATRRPVRVPPVGPPTMSLGRRVEDEPSLLRARG